MQQSEPLSREWRRGAIKDSQVARGLLLWRNKETFKARGPTLSKNVYEISKSRDFEKDFGISRKILLEISRFHLRFQDLAKIFEISIEIPRFQ